MSFMFWGCSSLIDLDVTSFDTNRVTNMSGMFAGCTDLPELNVLNFRTGNVVQMNQMFVYCETLEELDLSKFDTSKVSDMSSLFGGCLSLEELDISNFSTSAATSMQSMFSGCQSLTELELSHFSTPLLTGSGMTYLFSGCTSLESVDISNFNTSKVTSMQNVFSGCSSLKELDLMHFDVTKVTTMQGMFAGCSSLAELDLSDFHTGSLRFMLAMFQNCSSLKTLDLSNFSSQSLSTPSRGSVFSNCDSLATVVLGPEFDFTDLTPGQTQYFLPNPANMSSPHGNTCYWVELDSAGERTSNTYGISGYGAANSLNEINSNVSVATTYIHHCLHDYINVTVPTQLEFSVNHRGEVIPDTSNDYTLKNEGNVKVEVTSVLGKIDSSSVLPATVWQCLVPSASNAVVWQGSLSFAGTSALAPQITPTIEIDDTLELLWQPMPDHAANKLAFTQIFLAIMDDPDPVPYASVCYIVSKAA